MRGVSWLFTCIAVVGLPLTGFIMADGNLEAILAFPPEFGRVAHEPFNLKLSLLVLITIPFLLVLWQLLKRRDRIYRHNLILQRRHFPKWGYAGYLLVIVSWAVAWSRVEWLTVIQAYAFTPLWLGFIIVINAHVHRLSNTAPLYKAPGKFALLFLLSSGFWWVFEYLNRFSENWYYVGVEGVSELHYYIHGSLSFSTVLPAVFSVYRLFHCRDNLHKCFFLGPRVPLLKKKSPGVLVIAGGLLGMIGVGLYPTICYPFLWLGPVLVYGGMEIVIGDRNKIKSLARGDWRWIAFWAMAGLSCGFFWEFWNFLSLLKWEYGVSYFNGLHVFEMPLLGYLGYLPFGVLCGFVTQMVFPKRASIEFSPN